MRFRLVFFLVLTMAAEVRAQGVQNYNDIIPGARAGSMGGAFTGVADDSTAVIHNPAGLAHAPDAGLSLSVSAYGFQRTTVNDVFASSSESVDLQLDSLLFYPGATAYVLPIGDEDAAVRHTIAFSIIAPRFTDVEGVEHLSLDSSGIELDAFQSRVQKMLQAGPSYAFRTGRLSVGASVFVQYATFNDKISTSSNFYFDNDVGGVGAARLLDFQFSAGQYFGLTGSLGALLEVGPKTRIGLNIQFPSLRLGGHTTTYLAEAASLVNLDESGGVLEASLYQDVFREIEGDTNVRTPWVFSLGGSHYFGDHLVALDVDLYLPVSSFDFVEGVGDPGFAPAPAELPGLDDERGFDGRISEPRRNLVVNAGLGVDFQASPAMHIMAGLYTDFSSVPVEALDAYNRIHLFGASFGVRHIGKSSTLTVGVTARYGQGNAAGLTITDAFDVIQGPADARQWSIALLVGGTRAISDDDEEDEEEEEEEEDDEERQRSEEEIERAEVAVEEAEEAVEEAGEETEPIEEETTSIEEEDRTSGQVQVGEPSPPGPLR